MATLKKDKGKKILAIIAVFAIIIVAYVIFISSGSDTSSDPNFATTSDDKDFLKVDFNVLSDEVMDEFHSWSSIPVEVGSTGKNNPFAQ